MSNPPEIALIDDDAAVLDAVAKLLQRAGLQVSSFASAKSFLAALDKRPRLACIVSDIRMPSMSGMALHRALKERGIDAPLIFITGHGDVDLAVAAIKAGASDFIQKPIDGRRLIASIEDAIARSRSLEAERGHIAEMRRRYESLSDRQKEVMILTAKGQSSKEIAASLALSPRTVEHYREWVMEKMHSSNVAELVYMAVRLDLLGTR